MRIIGGQFRSRILATFEGENIRPTSDRAKEALFNILSNRIYGARVLDLFSGSGAIGIEALSRGAKDVVMVEQSAEALACIKENLKTTKFMDDARVLAMDVFSAIPKLDAEGKAFDIIFMDPPYDNELEKRALIMLAESSLVNEDTLIVVEASAQTKFSYVEELGLEVFREKNYKNNRHVFIQTNEKEPA